MPIQPTMQQVHVDQPLTNVSIAYVQSDANFIARSVAPNVPVDHQSNIYRQYDRSYWYRNEVVARGPGEESGGMGYGIKATDKYFCPVYAVHLDVPWQVADNADPGVDLQRNATQMLTRQALLNREILTVANFATGKWTGEKAGQATADATHVVYWNLSSATPIEDVATAIGSVLGITGYEPNKMVLGYSAYKALKNNPEIVDRIKYNFGGSGGSGPDSPSKVTPRTLAALFEVDEVLIMKSVQNTAAENATASYSFIGDKFAWLGYVNPAPSLLAPSALYTFVWQRYRGAQGPDGQAIFSFPMRWLNSDRIEMEMVLDPRLIAADLGYFFNAVVQ